MYRITKVLNHNAVLAQNLDDRQENLVVGKGAGFGRKPGERVDFTGEVTVYQLSQKCDRGNPRELVKRIDPIYLSIANSIILDARKTFGQVDTSILVPMATTSPLPPSVSPKMLPSATPSPPTLRLCSPRSTK